MNLTGDERYPIGKFKFDNNIDDNLRSRYIKDIEEQPNILRKTVEGLNDEQIDTPYRKGGWTIRQVVHHLPDSHLNAYVRFKLTLTENEPVIKTYEEGLWAELRDSKNTPISVSLDLLSSLHQRWVILLRTLSDSDFKKNYIHPDWGKVNLYWALAQYAWHGKHHTAHITKIKEKMNW
jgi:hypothetical protein